MQLVAPTSSEHVYPAITACIIGNRAPDRAELRCLLQRIAREAGLGGSAATTSFALRRVLVRAARAALAGGAR